MTGGNSEIPQKFKRLAGELGNPYDSGENSDWRENLEIFWIKKDWRENLEIQTTGWGTN